jgi:hypothetical protein
MTPEYSPSKLENGLFLLVAVFALAVWAVVGLLTWAFVLFRMTTVVTALAILAGLSASPSSTMGPYVHASIGFYPRGFRRIWDGFFLPEETAPSRYTGFWRAAVDSVFSIVFWFGFLFAFRPVVFEPVIDWSQRVFSTIVQTPK